MDIKRVLNNNAVISLNSRGNEVLLLGKGIAFNKKKGQPIEIDLVEKTFLLRNKDTQNKFTELLIDVPLEYILVVEKIINFGKIKLGKNLNEIIYVNLTDHVYSAVQRYNEGIVLKNPLRWDIKRFYPDEYEVGERAIQIVQKELHVDFEIDEAAFIAIHFVNAEDKKNFNKAYEITEITRTIEEIIKKEYNTEFDENSLDYYRFITHVKFFAQRLLGNEHYEDEDDDLLKTLKSKYQREYTIALKINEYVEKQFCYSISSTELLYLTIHIGRLTKNLS